MIASMAVMNKSLIVDVALLHGDHHAALAMDQYYQLVVAGRSRCVLSDKVVLNSLERLRRKNHHGGSITEESDVVLLVDDLGILREGPGKALQVLPVRFCNGIHVAHLEAFDELVFRDINDGAMDDVLFDLHCVYYAGTAISRPQLFAP